MSESAVLIEHGPTMAVLIDQGKDGVIALEVPGVPAVVELLAQGSPGSPGPQGNPGTQGVPGPTGSPGTGTVSFGQAFLAPSTDWVIVHGLNTKALSVVTTDVNDNEIEGAVHYDSLNSVTVSWYYPETGYARLNG